MTLSLRYTAAIGRELGGFNQYLQNNVYSYVAGRYQPINFLERLEKSIRQAFDAKLELLQIGFFDSMNHRAVFKSKAKQVGKRSRCAI